MRPNNTFHSELEGQKTHLTYCYDKLAFTNVDSCACAWTESFNFVCEYNRNTIRRVNKLPSLIEITRHSKKKDKLKKELRDHTEFLKLFKVGDKGETK